MENIDYINIFKYYKSQMPLFLIELNNISQKHRMETFGLPVTAAVNYYKDVSELNKLVDDFYHSMFIYNREIFKKLLENYKINFSYYNSVIEYTFLIYNDILNESFFNEGVLEVLIFRRDTQYVNILINKLEEELDIFINYFRDRLGLLKFIESLKNKMAYLFNEFIEFLGRYKRQSLYTLSEFFNEDKRMQVIKTEIYQVLCYEVRIKNLDIIEYDNSQIKRFFDACTFVLNNSGIIMSSIFKSEDKILQFQKYVMKDIDLLIDRVK